MFISDKEKCDIKTTFDILLEVIENYESVLKELVLINAQGFLRLDARIDILENRTENGK